MTKKTYTGINIQWPISRKILSGKKTIETRFYPLPAKYLNQEMLLIETPGTEGKFKSRITAIFKITDCFKYKDHEAFYADYHRHFVDRKSPWAWNKPKYGWSVEVVRVIDPPRIFAGRKGIVYTRGISL